MRVFALTMRLFSISSRMSSRVKRRARDVLAFFRKAVAAFPVFRVDDAAIQGAGFVERAGACHERVQRDQFLNLAAAFFPCLTSRDVGVRLPRFDDSGHALDQPGVAAGGVGARAELFDQHRFMLPRVERQNRNHLPPGHHFAADRSAHAAPEQGMTQCELIDLDVAIVAAGGRQNFDGVFIHPLHRFHVRIRSASGSKRGLVNRVARRLSPRISISTSRSSVASSVGRNPKATLFSTKCA